MKTKRWIGIVLATLAVVGGAGVVACKGGEETVKYTVTYCDATQPNDVLKKEEVAQGGKASDWTPSREGYTFVDWYATADLLHAFDFNSAVDRDTTVYGFFAADTFTEDTRAFYVLGTSEDSGSILYDTAWKIKDAGKQALKKMQKSETNEYTITLDLYEGDQFQFAVNNAFQNQRGFGYIVDAGGYLKESKNFLNPNPRVSNIIVTQSGNYTFTLKTHPWSDLYDTSNSSYTEENKENYNFNVQDTIRVVRNGDVSAAGRVRTKK